MRSKKIKSYAAALMIAVSAMPGNIAAMPTAAKYGTGQNIVEHLDRGIYAVKSGNGMFVSWRWNADDADNAEFRLYRDGQLIYTSKAGVGATSYQDNGGSTNSKYRVDTLVNGTVVSSEECHFNSGMNYFDIPLNSPGSQYTPNDCVVGDVDGDGQYEIFLKWEGKALDNSQAGYTDNVYIDCLTLEGKTLWRIDMGRNIRAGQHYTQMCVADFDCDGRAELITKTADGTKDGKGKVIGDGSKDYRNPGGYILEGAEYMTLFDGQTGAALDTINFPVPRGNVGSWGDTYGNRVDRFNSGIAYLDGVHPSAVYGRGYYTRMTISAVDVVNGKLSVRWIFDSNNKGSESAAGQGNHNLMTADVDNDGRQEISMGDCVIDDNGKLLWSSGKGHGDAQHLGDFIPERPGLELWQCHEHGPTYGVTLFDAKDGKVIFHKDGDKDTGRCCADNVYAGNPGAEFWGARPAKTVMDKNGNKIAGLSLSMNFLIYWDGDLEREMFSGTTVSKMTSTSKVDYIFNADGCESNNSTKAVPGMTVDLFGDWREELVMRTSDNKHLRVWCTTSPTDVRLTTLMHDPQYRTQNCCQQSAYNQPPHTSFFLGTGYSLPERPNVTVLGGNEFTIADGTLIKDLEVNDRASRYSWSIQQGLNSGKEVFGDRSCKFTSVPEQLKGAEWIRTACDSKKFTGDEATFTAAKDITVYLGIDTRAEDNAVRLSNWTKTELTLTDDGNPNVTYNIYKKDVKSGQKVTLGAVNMNTAVNYVVAATEYNENTVTNPTSPVTTEPVTTQPQNTSSDFIYGDLNYDGRVDVFDMILMRQELVSGELDRSTKRRADVDADGKIGAADAVQLQSFLLNGGSFSAVTEKRMFAYAVDQTLSDCIEESTNEGFRDKAYVNLDNKVGSNIEWKITAPIDGNYLCTFGTANGSADNRKMKIEVNGLSDYWVQDFLTTGGWNIWQERGIVLPLKKGENTIKMTSETVQGGPNLDYLHIEWTDEPIAQVYEEPLIVTTPVQSNISRTIYIAGDSTVQTYNAKYAPQQGWGAFLGEDLPQEITVSNRAIAGRSSKSFYDNGRLDSILDSIKQNDYLLIQFGINDAASNKAERYAPTCGKVPGTAGSFEDYMAKYIEGAKSKGATPVLVTTVIGLKSYDSKSKKFVGSYSNYCNAMKQLAKYYNIPCIDLNSLMVAHYNSVGYDTAYTYHMCSTGSSDTTHFTETGAKAVAKLVADEMKKQGLY